MANLFLFEVVTPLMAEYLVATMLGLDKRGEEEINLYINSPGGYVTDMFGIIDTMNMIKAKVRTIVVGNASSAAAVIASAGEERLITENSDIMIHEVSGFAIGTTSEMKEQVDQSKKLQDKLMNILAKGSNRNRDQIEADVFKKDLFLTANEALQYGLVDKVIGQESPFVAKLSEGISFKVDVSGDKEIHLLQTGNYKDVEITNETLNGLKKHFDDNIRGQEISIDYTHENDTGEKKAACWIKSLEVRNDGLYARVEYTPTGLNMVTGKEYKYASAEFSRLYKTHNGDYVSNVLLGGTLTNRPAVKGLNVLKLSENKENKMDKTEILNMLKKDHSIDVSALQASLKTANAAVSSKETALEVLKAEKEGLETEKNKALAALNEKEMNVAFDGLVNDGKVVPAQKEMIFSKFENVEDLNDFYAEAPKVVNVKATGSSEGKTKFDGSTQKLINQGHISKEDAEKYLENKKD